MLRLLTICLILCSCASAPKTERIRWEFIDLPNGERRACLDEEGMKRLHEKMVRCQQQ
jgi:hypothetical protein